MTRKLFAITFATIFAACNSNPKTSTDTTNSTITDTTGFKNNAAADRGQVIELKGVSDTIVAGDGSRYVKVDPNKAAQNVAATTTPPAAVKAPATTHRSTAKKTTHSSGTRSSGGYSGKGSSGGGTGTETASTPVPAKKKGWSKAAKGAAIGAGAGAVGGAIISKKKGLGAVIGGVVGGAGGYIIGRSKDKKDGRY